MTIMELAEVTGIEGYHIRRLIQMQISETRRKKLRKQARDVCERLGMEPTKGRRHVCKDCGTPFPEVNDECTRCVRNAQNRVSYKESPRRHRNVLDWPSCDAVAFSNRFTPCKYAGKHEINGIPVCGFHKTQIELWGTTRIRKCEAHTLSDRYAECRFSARHEWEGTPVCGQHRRALQASPNDPKDKCQANTITDRFAECSFTGIYEWDGVPVCGRHKGALEGSRGLQTRNELWRHKYHNYQKRHRRQNATKAA